MTATIEAVASAIIPPADVWADINPEDFAAIGVRLTELEGHLELVRGEAVELGWLYLAPRVLVDGERPTRTAWLRYCAGEWKCSPATVSRAWTLYLHRGELSEDVPLTVQYEVIAAAGSSAAAALAEAAGATAWEVRTAKTLRREAGWPHWSLPMLKWRDDKLVAEYNGECAVLAVRRKCQSPLARAGLALLRLGARVSQ